jgi:AcrR family transcriptional regulator
MIRSIEKASIRHIDEIMNQSLDIKERLILAALELFADQGIHGVSMRNINVLAGTKNSGAAHYHFGNKLGLLEALIIYLNKEIKNLRADEFGTVQARVASGDANAKDILKGFYSPYINLYKEKDFGPHAVKFYARLAVEADPQIQELINKHHGPTFEMLDELMAVALPHMERIRLRRQLIFTWISAIHGLADLEYMHNTFFGDLSAGSQEEILDQFIDFIAAGMLADDLAAEAQEGIKALA